MSFTLAARHGLIRLGSTGSPPPHTRGGSLLSRLTDGPQRHHCAGCEYYDFGYTFRGAPKAQSWPLQRTRGAEARTSARLHEGNAFFPRRLTPQSHIFSCLVRKFLPGELSYCSKNVVFGRVSFLPSPYLSKNRFGSFFIN